MASENPTLTLEILLVLSIFTFTFLLSLSSVIRIDVLAVLVLVIIGATGLLPPEQLFSGFSNEASISLIAIMIIGAGLEKSGIALRVARWILKLGKERPSRISTLLMAASGLLSAFMRSLGATALLLPIATRITARTNISKSRLLMPIAFCSAMGGTLTMVGSGSLLVLNSLLQNAQVTLDDLYDETLSLAPFKLFEVLPLGLLLLGAGILYLTFIGKRLLPANTKPPLLQDGTKPSHFLTLYGKGREIYELKIPPTSPLSQVTVKEIELLLDPSSSLLAVVQKKEFSFPPLRKMTMTPYTSIALMGLKEKIATFAETHGLQVLPKLHAFSELLHPIKAGFSEAVVPPYSGLVGKEFRELHMRRTYGIQALSLYRGNTAYTGEALNDLVLRSGDTLAMFSPWENLQGLRKNRDFVLMTTNYPREEIRSNKALWSFLFFVIPILLILSGHFPISVGLLLGATGMIATGVLTIDEAYSAVSWKTVFLLAGLIPLGLVLQTTGTLSWLVHYLLPLGAHLSPWKLQAFLAILATFFASVLSGTGATIVLVPLALELAIKTNGDPRLYALIVAIAASNTFLLPTQQVNALVAGPGLYQPRDFIRVGGLMTVLYWIIMLVAIPWLF